MDETSEFSKVQATFPIGMLHFHQQRATKSKGLIKRPVGWCVYSLCKGRPEPYKGKKRLRGQLPPVSTLVQNSLTTLGGRGS